MIAVEVKNNITNFNCATCRLKNCDETGNWPGSLGPAPRPVWRVKSLDMKSTTCLLPMVTELSWWLLEQYQHYKNRMLPIAGGLLDQPNVYLKAMEFLDAHDSQITH